MVHSLRLGAWRAEIAGRCPVWEVRLGACSRRARRDVGIRCGAWACLARGRARERVARELETGENAALGWGRGGTRRICIWRRGTLLWLECESVASLNGDRVCPAQAPSAPHPSLDITCQAALFLPFSRPRAACPWCLSLLTDTSPSPISVDGDSAPGYVTRSRAFQPPSPALPQPERTAARRRAWLARWCLRQAGALAGSASKLISRSRHARLRASWVHAEH